ncbi:GntR family transcriptional regulator [Nocardia carnea]|uniref:GntR family transcriptional regulator n=1 Tax=Nocardia carnea TaxID=37328 RepID=UPI0032AFDEDC
MIHTDGVATVPAREDVRTEVRAPGGMALSKVYRVRAEIDTMLDGLRPGDRVPAERELAGRFGVARETVRHALRDLAVEGRIRRQGRGTVLARPKVVRPLAPESAGEEAAGVVRRLLSWEDGVADAEVARDLDLPPRTPIMTLERLLFADGDPIALERIDLSLDRFGWLRAAFDPLSSLATTIGDSGVEYAGATERIETVLAAPREAGLLRCRPAVPLFRVVRRGIDTQGRPIERVAALYRGDRVAFEVRTGGRGR